MFNISVRSGNPHNHVNRIKYLQYELNILIGTIVLTNKRRNELRKLMFYGNISTCSKNPKLLNCMNMHVIEIRNIIIRNCFSYIMYN